MSKKILFILVLMLVVAAGTFALDHLPRHYWVLSQPMGIQAVWHGDEAFLFLGQQTQGRTTTFVGEKLGGFLPRNLRMFRDMPDAMRGDLIAVHVLGGQVRQQTLPRAPFYQRFVVFHGTLYAVPPVPESTGPAGYRWTGSQFDTISESQASEVRKSVAAGGNSDGDSEDEDDEGAASSRDGDQEALANQGWQTKFVNTYLAKDKSHAVKLAHSELAVNVHAFAKQEQEENRKRSVFSPVSSISLGGPALAKGEVVLYQARPEWEQVSEARYRTLTPFGMRAGTLSPWLRFITSFYALTSLLPFLPILLYFFNLFRLKQKVLNAMPTGFGFPPATAEQFGQLNQDALRSYTEALEKLGFTRLMDFSLVPKSGTYIPGFARLMVHAEDHCFAEIFQVFPPNKKPLPMTVGINSHLDGGWSLSNGNGKMTGTRYMLRLPRALWINQPEASPAEMLRVHLERRHQIASDLGVRVLTDMSPAAYFSCVQKQSEERRANFQKKNFAAALGSRFLYPFHQKKEWMGDYQKQVAFRREPWRSPVAT